MNFIISQLGKMQNHIRKIRERKGMTLESVAEALGCTKAQISKLERGHIRLNDEWLDKISYILCCSVHASPLLLFSEHITTL